MHAPPQHSARANGPLERALDAIERLGNRLPDPITLFAGIAVFALLLSWLAARSGWTELHPVDGSVLAPVDLLTSAGVRRIFTEALRNFTGFAPLGTVLVAMLGIGLAERTGLVSAALRASVLGAPPRVLTLLVVFVGVNANIASDAGIVLLPPIAGALFAAVGRHPLAGIAAAYAGVSGGFSANLMPSSLDVLLVGFTRSAVENSGLFPGYTPGVLGNYFFMVVSTPVLTLAGAWVTERLVEPRLGAWKPAAASESNALTATERRGLRAAGVTAAVTVLTVAALTLLPGAPLMDAAKTGLQRLDPFFESMVVLVSLLFFLPGLAYGIASGVVRSDRDVAEKLGETMSSMGGYIVLAFVAGQMVAYFAWSNLGALTAIAGADALRAWGFTGAPLLIAFILMAASIDMVLPSASAKWAIMAPVFVPMFGLLGYSPEGTQVVFRIGDSFVNIITPLLPYVPFVLATMRRYDPAAGVGSMISLMLPYSVVFFVLWTLLLLIYLWTGWPIGPGVGLLLQR